MALERRDGSDVAKWAVSPVSAVSDVPLLPVSVNSIEGEMAHYLLPVLNGLGILRVSGSRPWQRSGWELVGHFLRKTPSVGPHSEVLSLSRRNMQSSLSLDQLTSRNPIQRSLCTSLSYSLQNVTNCFYDHTAEKVIVYVDQWQPRSPLRCARLFFRWTPHLQ